LAQRQWAIARLQRVLDADTSDNYLCKRAVLVLNVDSVAAVATSAGTILSCRRSVRKQTAAHDNQTLGACEVNDNRARRIGLSSFRGAKLAIQSNVTPMTADNSEAMKTVIFAAS
jgi:hypothetical protein